MCNPLMSRLARAMLERYPDETITGYLVDARIVSFCVVGRLYNDLWNVYPDGTLITSAEISVLEEHGKRWLIKTRDGDCYVVVSFHRQGGRRSLYHLAALFKSASLAHSRWCLH